MRYDYSIPGLHDRERIAVIILRSLESAFRNAANQIANDLPEQIQVPEVSAQVPGERTEPKKKPQVLNAQEAAKMLRISKPSLYELARSGKIQYFKVGRVFRVSEQAIMDYIRMAETEPK